MARVVIEIEDGTGLDGKPGVNIQISSVDPALPVKDGDLDFDEATLAQITAYGAVFEVAGHAATRHILVRNEG